jgi:hypothetical protein
MGPVQSIPVFELYLERVRVNFGNESTWLIWADILGQVSHAGEPLDVTFIGGIESLDEA